MADNHTPAAAALLARVDADVAALRSRRLHPYTANTFEQLATALRAALADQRRIDWLESQANEPRGLLLHDGSETGRMGLGLRPGNMVRTLRQAIDDAAMTADGGGV